MRRNIAGSGPRLLVLFAITMAGCVDQLEPVAGGDSTSARGIYDHQVYPILRNKCGSCHLATAPAGNQAGFVALSLDSAHATIVTQVAVVGNYMPAAAPILLKIKAGHNNVSYTSDDISKIVAWLQAELAEGMTGGETPAVATRRLIDQWSACMTHDMFDQAKMGQTWGNLMADNTARCESCHATGAEGFIATTDGSFMFSIISSNKYYMLQYFSVTGLDQPATAKVIINPRSFLWVSQGQDPHREHPRFNATDNEGMTALEDFYGRVHTAVVNSGTTPCGASQLTN